ncbi:phosphatidylglycerophosphatase A [Permianibacter sp. IMCC34836]|uniref:phosphatidylglycerophosphatase A family protein n=1 Tax=Permianibacter fluminis TaxID=2738515 RepID=UPI001551BB32|nr:phosphatidylglycerophosphatase A [Permianibacter fluminis]NQD36880.1 phosphatidylglycerophosphatase A [Permianibacter fluminis]
MIKPQSFWHWLAVGFGSGLAPKAPGTFGTLAALPLVILGWWQLSPLVYAALTVPLFALGVYASERTARDFGIKDPGAIVVDEWVGLWASALFLPFHWLNVLLIFVLFRIFDIAKPWPVSWADRRCQGGLGIMLDDLLAGAMACAVLQLGWRVLT